MCLSTNINKAKNHILPLIIKHKIKIDDDIWRSISQRTTSHMCIPVTYNDLYFQRHMSWSLSLHSIVWGVAWLWYRWNCLLKHFSPFSEKKMHITPIMTLFFRSIDRERDLNVSIAIISLFPHSSCWNILYETLSNHPGLYETMWNTIMCWKSSPDGYPWCWNRIWFETFHSEHDIHM
jgi:hypothetical protein